MTEIAYNQIGAYLQKTAVSKTPRVCLIHGEPELVAQSAAALLDHLLGADPGVRDLSCDVIDGLTENIPDLIERLNTYALVAGPKVYWFKEARLFDTAGRHQRIFEQTQQAYEGDNIPRAAKLFFSLCVEVGFEPAGAGYRQLPAELQPFQEVLGEGGIRRLNDHIQAQGWSLSKASDDVQNLVDAIEKGFPPNHYLMITAGTKVPKNRKFYKCVAGRGLVVDCHVPLGERKADKAAQETVLREIADRTLRGAGKKMNPGLLAQVVQLTGFDPATFRNNIEKLIDYSGPRPEITREDIDSILNRSKSDPIYELTNAVAERNLQSALFYLNTLLANDFHPLQVLSALANQMRRLLIAKDFTRSTYGRDWQKGLPFPQFQSSVLPAIQQYDAQIASERSQWEPAESEGLRQGGDKGSKKPSAELGLASGTGSAYPVFQTLLKSENFTQEELIAALAQLGEADIRLKSSGQDPVLVVKHLVMAVCHRTGGT